MNKRVGFLDELKGFSIICVVVFHTLYLLNYSYNVNIPVFFDSWFRVVVDIFIGIFIFIAGISSNYSHDNLRRGVKCFFLGMIITFAFAVFNPSSNVTFGILHSIGISVMIYALFENFFKKIPTIVGLVVSITLFIYTFNVQKGYVSLFGLFRFDLPQKLYQSNALIPLGFINGSFSTADYEPLLPWFFMFLAGVYFGVYVKNNRLPKSMYSTHVPFLSALGKYSLWIYIFHVPVIATILSLIFNKTAF